MLSLEDKKYALEMWLYTSSRVKVRRSFRKRRGYHTKNLPAISTLQRVVHKFEDHGTVGDRRKGSVSAITATEVRKVERLYQNNQRLSLRTASRRLDISKQKVSLILRRRLLKKAYKAKIRMQLTERQRATRVEASQALLGERRILPKVWFSDESWFYSDGIAQKKNQYYWTINKDAVRPVESQLVPIKVMVWAAVSSKGLIGPYFFHKNGSHINVNKDTYADCLTWFVDKLSKQRKLRSSWFMQDGAPSHTAIKSRQLIMEHFPGRAVGKHFPLSWPPYSPDLTPADFWLWPKVKSIIFSPSREPFTSIAALKRAITFAFNKIRRQDLSHLTAAVERRLQKCIDNQGFRW